MDKKITLVRDESGDWEGLYADGVLLKEGHSLDGDDVLSALGIDYDYIYSHLRKGARLPQDLAEVPTQDEWERQQKLNRVRALREEADALEQEAIGGDKNSGNSGV